MALRKVFTAEEARKSANIFIKSNMIIVDYIKPSKKYGKVGTTKVYAPTASNLAVARRYK